MAGYTPHPKIGNVPAPDLRQLLNPVSGHLLVTSTVHFTVHRPGLIVPGPEQQMHPAVQEISPQTINAITGKATTKQE